MQINGKSITFKFGFKAAQALQQETGVAIPQIIQRMVALDFDTIKTTFRHACGQSDDTLLEEAVDEHGLKPVMEAIALALAMFLDPKSAKEMVEKSQPPQKKAPGPRPKA